MNWLSVILQFDPGTHMQQQLSGTLQACGPYFKKRDVSINNIKQKQSILTWGKHKSKSAWLTVPEYKEKMSYC